MSPRKRCQSYRTVRPRSGGVPVLLCVLMFAITAMVVNRVGRERWVPVNGHPTFTATAYVVEKNSGDKTPFAYTDVDRYRAIETADALAKRQVDDCAAKWRREIEGTRANASRLAEKARIDYQASVDRLEIFERQCQKRPQATTSVVPQADSQPPMIENPRWLDLRRQISDLKQRREQLLQDRTPLHPAVQEIATRLTELEQQLAVIPQKIPGERVKTVTAPAPQAPVTVDPARQNDQRMLAQLTAVVERARLVRDKAEQAEKQATDGQQTKPEFVVEHAKTVQNEAQVDYGWRRLLWTTFAASLLMAFGIGSVAAGAKIEPPVATVEEVEALLGESVLGTMPADDPAPDMSAIRCQTATRRATIAIGVIQVIACPIVAFWGVMGI